jgi:hypothetical protein
MTENDKRPAAQPNEGEGNKTAARAFNKAEERFAKSGKVEKKAREAQQAVDGPEGKELAEAEAIGKSHSAGEDAPKTKRDKPA